MIRIAAFGPIRVFRDDGGELSLIGQQPKRLALLAYLAAARPRGMQRRDTIVALLWPELGQERARAALRQALHSLRKSLGADVFVSDGTETIGLNERTVQCDLWNEESSPAAPLFDGLFLSGAPEFEEWLSRERKRTRDVARDGAWASADHALAEGRAADAVRFAQHALSFVEFDEAALRRGMQLLADAGERALAIETFERFSTTLRAELDLAPSAETLALADVLRRSSPIATPQRVHRALPQAPFARKPRRYVLAATLSIIAVAAAARFAPSASTQIDPRRIRVTRFENETGLPSIDTLARTLEASTRSTLASLDNATVDANADEPAGTEVRGAIRAVGDSLELRAEVVNGASRVLVRTVIMNVARGGGDIERFNDRVSAAVATWLYPGWGNALSQPRSYASYRLFLDGLRRIKLEQHEEATSAFLRAFAEDSSFTTANLLAAGELYQMRRFAAADSIVQAMAPRRALLPPVDGHLFDWLTRSLAGDHIAARSAMEAIVRIAPTAELAWLQLAIDNVETARPREALEALDHLRDNADVTDGWASLWATRAEALHIMHDHTRELAVVRAGMRQHPELRVLVNYELSALAALGDFSAIDRALERAAATSVAPGLMRLTALELAAHGYESRSRELLERTRAWYQRRPAAEHDSLRYRLGFARTLYLLDDRAAARAMYESLSRDYPKCLDCIGALGVLAARNGKTSPPMPATPQYQYGRNELWAARIASARGDKSGAASQLHAAFAAGSEFDVLTHADPDLRRVNPDSIYKSFARVPY